jgi:hypothetical protein
MVFGLTCKTRIGLWNIRKPTRIKEKRKAKEELAENNTRGNFGCWEDMGRN